MGHDLLPSLPLARLSPIQRAGLGCWGSPAPPVLLQGMLLPWWWVLVMPLHTASQRAESILSTAGISSPVALLRDLWKGPVLHGAICCPGTQLLACVLPHLQRWQDAL